MILTFKVKHGKDFSQELVKAKMIAEYVIKNHPLSLNDVKHFGLKMIVAKQILRKYSRNKNIKHVRRIKLTIPSKGINVKKDEREIHIPSLDLTLNYHFRNDFERIVQIELDNEFAYISVTIPEKPLIEPSKWIGIDRNSTGYIAVVADPTTGKVYKFGKKAQHIHEKYKNIRRRLQKKRKYRALKKINNRESRIIRDLNHKVARAIVNIAKEQNAGIKLEKLEGIRKNKKYGKSLHSWSYFQLGRFIEYKARLEGIPVTYVEPRNTSQECSRCGCIGIRVNKTFKCPYCGHVDHADVNASFVIASRQPLMAGVGRLHADRDACKGSLVPPKGQL
jgi:putative transposase